jgi:hypothetical protein
MAMLHVPLASYVMARVHAHVGIGAPVVGSLRGNVREGGRRVLVKGRDGGRCRMCSMGGRRRNVRCVGSLNGGARQTHVVRQAGCGSAGTEGLTRHPVGATSKGRRSGPAGAGRAGVGQDGPAGEGELGMVFWVRSWHAVLRRPADGAVNGAGRAADVAAGDRLGPVCARIGRGRGESVGSQQTRMCTRMCIVAGCCAPSQLSIAATDHGACTQACVCCSDCARQLRPAVRTAPHCAPLTVVCRGVGGR